MNEETIKQLQALPRVLIENGIAYYIIPQEEYEKLQVKEQEIKRLKDKIDYMEEYIKVVENARNEFEKESKFLEAEKEQAEQKLEKIKKIANGMHDLWINKTPYTDMDNLVKHLLECELNRIRYKLDEISECEVENDNK